MRVPLVLVLVLATAVAACGGSSPAASSSPGTSSVPTGTPLTATPAAGGTSGPFASATAVATAVASPAASPESSVPGVSPGASVAASSSPSGAVDPFAVVVNVVAAVEPSVVTVLTDVGLGSGIIYDGNGSIVTNNHVVADSQQFTVALATGERLPATVVGTDPETDVAVLHVDRSGLPAAQWEPGLPPVGSLAVAIGSPLGFEDTVTVGVVSGVERAIPGSAQQTAALVDLIQTDAAISPGNSGGALVDANSNVMGMNVAYIPPTAPAVSIGFAIPAATVTSVADDLIAGRTVKHTYLGIRYGPVTPEVAQRYHLTVDSGLYVLEVQTSSPAAAAGIQPGDVITAVDGQPMAQVEDLLNVLRQHNAGDTVAVTLVGNGQQQTVNVTLGEHA